MSIAILLLVLAVHSKDLYPSQMSCDSDYEINCHMSYKREDFVTDYSIRSAKCKGSKLRYDGGFSDFQFSFYHSGSAHADISRKQWNTALFRPRFDPPRQIKKATLNFEIKNLMGGAFGPPVMELTFIFTNSTVYSLTDYTNHTYFTCLPFDSTAWPIICNPPGVGHIMRINHNGSFDFDATEVLRGVTIGDVFNLIIFTSGYGAIVETNATIPFNSLYLSYQ